MAPPWPGVAWIADNACYTGDKRYLTWLARHAAHAESCAFATAPDIVGDATATLARAMPMLPRIRAAGYRAALVAHVEDCPFVHCHHRTPRA